MHYDLRIHRNRPPPVAPPGCKIAILVKRSRKIIPLFVLAMFMLIWLVLSTPWKNISQKTEPSPGRGENKKYLKPPPSYAYVSIFLGIHLGIVSNP